MRISIAGLTLLAAGSMSLCAQEQTPVTFGFKAELPITEMFSAHNTNGFGGFNSIPTSSYNSAVPRYGFGLSAEFHLPYRFRFEADGLFRRGGFGNSYLSGPGTAYETTKFNDWEIPALLKTNITMGHFRPFIDFGAAYRHISTISQATLAPGFNYVQMTDNSAALHNRNSYGGVAGIGFTIKEGPFELSPEVRYTRWANESFQISGLRTNLNEGDILLGIGF